MYERIGKFFSYLIIGIVIGFINSMTLLSIFDVIVHPAVHVLISIVITLVQVYSFRMVVDKINKAARS